MKSDGGCETQTNCKSDEDIRGIERRTHRPYNKTAGDQQQVTVNVCGPIYDPLSPTTGSGARGCNGLPGAPHIKTEPTPSHIWPQLRVTYFGAIQNIALYFASI